jgi:hypothetical protein
MSRPRETVYRGTRHVGPAGEVLGVEVERGGRPITPARSLRVWSHSPTGFEWGYSGSGPAQLALALMLDVLVDDDDLAQRCYQWVKWHTVATFRDAWTITAGELLDLVERWRAEVEAPAFEVGDIRPFVATEGGAP